MIVTLTANPSLDRTATLPGPLQRGRVQRAVSVVSEPGGKGVNVARVVLAAGRPALAVLPGAHDDPLLVALREAAVPHRAVDVVGAARVNLTVAEPDGTTTKINDPGSALGPESLAELGETLVQASAGARWAVLSGSLPPGVPAQWYAGLVTRLHGRGVQVAVDTSGPPLLAAVAGDGAVDLPDLVKPNGEELAEIAGEPGADLEHDVPGAVRAAAALVDRGVGAVLATLGAAGALLVTRDGAWSASPPRVPLRSTVGAGDSALAGYLLADLADAGPAERLQSAVAHGAAAVSLPGSALPTPADVAVRGVEVRRLSPADDERQP